MTSQFWSTPIKFKLGGGLNILDLFVALLSSIFKTRDDSVPQVIRLEATFNS